ncbi:MAG TPA: 2OG-Fe(II) oxygenase [Blastocatellia bacterium]|nr:2OG-Fe(II) oxygenase [Blastocatellia bacterium]
MLSTALSPTTVVDAYTSQDMLKEKVRKSLHAEVSQSSTLLVKERLMALRGKLENHFELSFDSCEKPQFLVYKEGGYFQPHRDGEDEAGKPEYIKSRQISIVVFLNRESDRPAPNAYCGGALTFYGLIDDPKWKRYGFQLKGETGMLVAFRAGVLHEVTTVTHGTRCSIVSWFF